MSKATLSYDSAQRKATIEFPNGHQLKIGNIDEAEAQEFFTKHAEEFQKRDCILHTSSCIEVRSHG
jgi:hypothetical protein